DFSAKYPGIIQFHANQKRLGATKNFEQALTLTSGKYIFLCDQDDWWRPNKVAAMLESCHNHPAAHGVFSDSLIVDANLQSIGDSHQNTHLKLRGFNPDYLAEIQGDGDKFLAEFLKRVPPAGHDMMLKAQAKSYLLPFPELPDSYDTWIGLALATGDKWAFTPGELTLFRQHGANLSNSGQAANWRTKLAAARNSIRCNTFEWNCRMYEFLLRRLGETLPEQRRQILLERLEYSACRAAMNTTWFRRLPLIWHVATHRWYQRFGRGWQNLIQDLFLR
ncbi:MAG: glycosyltransferase, partial [Victivallaceae bacterium]